MEQERQKAENKDFEEVDPYTGEVEPPAEAAYQVTEIVPEDPGNRAGENFLLEEKVEFSDILVKMVGLKHMVRKNLLQ